MKATVDRDTGRFVEKVQKTINDYRMVEPGDNILVGVSGGPDSVCLLHLLNAFSAAWSIHLGVAHLNHALRPEESDRDAEFVAGLAESLGLPFFFEKASPETWKDDTASPEETARRVRYAFFKEAARTHGFDKVAVGHHAGDNAELFLMRMLTWSGPTGLSGIPPVREVVEGGQWIIRPLIRCAREEIFAYLERQDIPFVTDTTNFSMRFLRNQVRHRLIPELKSNFNPKIEEALNRLIAIFAAEDAWLHSLTETMFRSVVLKEKNRTCILSVEKLLETPVAAQRRMLRMAIEGAKGDLRRITFEHVESVRSLLSEISHVKRLHLPGGIRVVLEKEHLSIHKIVGDPRAQRDTIQRSNPDGIYFRYIIDGPGIYPLREIQKTLRVSRFDIASVDDIKTADTHVAFFDAQTLSFPLILRNRIRGDRFEPLGMKGSQKVKKYFIDHKVPAAKRSECPLLLSGGRIAWVAGCVIGHWARVTGSTREVVSAELLLALPGNND